VRRVIKAIALDKDLGDVSSIENLDAIKAIRRAH